jgi:hypothetical protein
MDESDRVGALCRHLDNELRNARCQISATEPISDEAQLQILFTRPQLQITWLSYLERARHDLEVSLRKIPGIPEGLISDIVCMNNTGMCIHWSTGPENVLSSPESEPRHAIELKKANFREIVPTVDFLREHRTNSFVFEVLLDKIQAKTAELEAKSHLSAEEQMVLDLSKEVGGALEELIRTANYRDVNLEDPDVEDIYSHNIQIDIGDIVYKLSVNRIQSNRETVSIKIEVAAKKEGLHFNFPAELIEVREDTKYTFLLDDWCLCKPKRELDISWYQGTCPDLTPEQEALLACWSNSATNRDD